MGTEEHKALVRRTYAAFTSGRLDELDALVGDDLVDHTPGFGDEPQGLAGTQAFVGQIHAAFPDVEFVIEDMIAEGDTVASRVVVRGTHRGEFFGVPATGKRVEMAVMDIVRLADGKQVEHWGLPDMLGLLQQLGVAPAPGQAPAH